MRVYYDFVWSAVFTHNRTAFSGGKSLAEVVRRECPAGKTPCLLLTILSDERAPIVTDDEFIVVVPIEDYLTNHSADAATSYYGRLAAVSLTRLSTLSEGRFSEEDLGKFLDGQLTAEALAAWISRSPDRSRILQDLVSAEADPLPVDIATALRNLDVEDAELLEEFANYVARVGDGSHLVKTILSQDGGEDLIRSLIDEGTVTSVDIVNTAYRKRQLDIFEKMLEDEEYWRDYAVAESISASKEEKVWQSFFCRNDWIFGYGLDYRFNGILQKEFHASGTQADGSESVITDFLLGDTKFTTFVEIKKPSTPIFGSSQNRSLSWRLSNDLIDGVSQILEHKASGEIKIAAGEMHDENGNLITQKGVDSKVILLIGDWSRVSFANDLEKRIKDKTFELYRRDSRNIKMLTYDELFERAKFIVDHKSNG